ncbi:hypothetical protein GCM10028777_39180 [Angustibacter speluncae]
MAGDALAAAPRHLRGPALTPEHEPVWYVSYGSNACRERLDCYLRGGRAPGARRVQPGARDSRPPSRSVPVRLPGRLRIAGRSRTWGGGMAFYDPHPGPPPPGPVLARAHLLTAQQLADVLVQEMHRDPAAVDLRLGLADLVPHRPVAVGPGRYETVLRVADVDGLPAVTLTAPDGGRSLPSNPPSPSYRAVLRAGLAEGHGLDAAAADAYLDGWVHAPDADGAGRGHADPHGLRDHPPTPAG